MGHQAWNLFTDPDYVRERLAFEEAEDAEREELVRNPWAQLAPELDRDPEDAA